jgi:hypothetical protein
LSSGLQAYKVGSLLLEPHLQSKRSPGTGKPSNSGGTDLEDLGSKPAWANSSKRPYLEKTFHKKRLVKWLKVYALSSSPSTAKKNLKVNSIFFSDGTGV